MEPKTLLDTDVLSGMMRKTPTAVKRARTVRLGDPDRGIWKEWKGQRISR